MEKWKQYKDTNYWVSDQGRFWSTYRGGSFRKLTVDKDGYLLFKPSIKGKQYTFKAHRVVAEMFKPNIDNLETIDHINGNRADNRVENLQWMSREDNISKGSKGRVSEKRQKIQQLDLKGNLIKVWNSQLEASKALGINQGNISNCIKGKNKTAGGFIFRSVDI